MIRNQAGGRPFSRRFTLVELLVVISIISVLAAMLLPALEGARNSARGAFCQGNQKQLAAAWLLYADDNSAWLPLMNRGASTTNHNYNWYQNVMNSAGYLPVSSWGGSPANGRARDGVWLCPAAHNARAGASEGVTYERASGYGLNSHHLSGYTPGHEWYSAAKPVKLDALKRASGVLLTGDEEMWSLGHPLLAGNLPEQSGELKCPVERAWNNLSLPAYLVPARHNERGNLSFPDGHASAQAFEALAANTNDIFGHSSR